MKWTVVNLVFNLSHLASVTQNKGPFEVSHRVKKNYSNKIVYTARNISAIDVTKVKKYRRCIGDADAVLGLHFLHMSEGTFVYDFGHLILKMPFFNSVNFYFVIKREH